MQSDANRRQLRLIPVALAIWMIAMTGLPLPAQPSTDLPRSTNEPAIDMLAYSSMPAELTAATKSYFTAAIQLVAEKGRWPERIKHDLIKRRDVSAERLEWSNFPVVVNLGQREFLPITLQVLPPPKLVRHCFQVERDLESLEKESLIKWPDDWRKRVEGQSTALSVHEFFVPLEHCSSWGFVHATPFDTPSVIGGNQTRTIGWLRSFCRANSLVSYEEFNHFPNFVGKNKDEAIWEGILASGQVDASNSVLRWVALRNVSTDTTTQWLAYFLEDACGAFSEPPRTAGFGERGTHVRSLQSPYYPSLQVSKTGLRHKSSDAPTEHNLLRIPRPRPLVVKEKVVKWYSEEWTICEQYYSEQKVPAWKLSVTKDSLPYREAFRLQHALEEADGEIWKLVLFSTIEPKSLIEVLGKIKGFDPALVSIDSLEVHYSQLQEINDRILSQTPNAPNRKSN